MTAVPWGVLYTALSLATYRVNANTLSTPSRSASHSLATRKQHASLRASLRKAARDTRDQLTRDYRESASGIIARAVCQLPAFRRANSVALYDTLGSEVATARLIRAAGRQRKQVLLPRIDKDRSMQFARVTPGRPLSRGPWGTRQPGYQVARTAEQPGIIVMPLVAFDSQRNRLGYGGGYYDRALQRWQNNPKSCRPLLVGIAFEVQRCEDIPAATWDVRPDLIVTEKAIYR